MEVILIHQAHRTRRRTSIKDTPEPDPPEVELEALHLNDHPTVPRPTDAQSSDEKPKPNECPGPIVSMAHGYPWRGEGVSYAWDDEHTARRRSGEGEA